MGKMKVQDSYNILVKDLFLGFGLVCQISSFFFNMYITYLNN